MNTKNILIGIAGVLLIDYVIARVHKTPKIMYVKKIPFNYNGTNIPPFGILIQEEDKNNEVLEKHELIHWEQYRKTGLILFLLKYGWQKMMYGYDKIPMEIEARRLSGEKTECLTDYTSCVRDGRSNTVTDSNFRV